MKENFNCERCGQLIPFAHYIRARWQKPTPMRCHKCGAVHAVLRGEVEVISRPMMPIDHAAGVVSPWMLPWTRPVQPGRYECKFCDLTEAIFLWWTGTHFVVDRHDRRTVRMGMFQTWRGVWA